MVSSPAVDTSEDSKLIQCVFAFPCAVSQMPDTITYCRALSMSFQSDNGGVTSQPEGALNLQLPRTSIMTD